MESDCLMGQEFPFRVMKNVLELVVVVAQHCECTKNHCIICCKMIKMVNVM